MIEFGGLYYTIDINAFSKAIKLGNLNPNDKISFKTIETKTNHEGEIISTKVTESVSERGLEIDSAKYELIKTMIDVVMDDVNVDADDKLGVAMAFDKFSLSYKIAFNTLISYGILVQTEIEE